MKTFLKIFLVFFVVSGFAQETSISGKITSQNQPVSFANIYLENTSKGTTANKEGEFILQNVKKGDAVIIVSAIGYKKFRRTIATGDKDEIRLNIDLEPSASELEEVRIVDEQTGITRRTPYNVSSLSMEGIENKGNPNGMMGTLRELPGVYGAEFGQGIVKPFIRGLGFSRVVTIYQGNKLENHQWGADHGLGINDLGIKRVEVIKGPASVLYGSGALGGVLLAKDQEDFLTTKKATGNIGTTFNSVSNGIRTYGSLGKSFDNDLFIATDFAWENHADYENGDGRTIGNSRFNTRTFRFHTGLEKEQFQNKLSFSYNHQNLGIITDEEMDDSSSLASTKNDRKMQLPFQQVADMLISYNQSTRHKNFETSVHVSHHYNDRKEIEENRSLIDMGLKQNHTFYNARLSFPNAKVKHNLGVQGSIIQQRNREESLDFLIPDARVFENGLYYLASLDYKSWFFQGALRYDHRKVTADASADYLVEDDFILPGNPESRTLTRFFKGFTGSFGVTNSLNDYNTLKFNISTGFRAPDLAELFSNGPHPGTSRFEQGNDAFDREQSLQADLSYTFQKKRFRSGISLFASQVDNFIYFAATGETMPENDLKIWAYQQTKASFYGLELEFKHHWLPGNRLETKLTGSMIRARDAETGNDLTFIPPDNFNAKVGYYGLKNKSLYLFSKLRVISDQARIGLNEEPTPGYTLLNLGLSKKFYFQQNSLNAGITVYNSLNKTYVDHMSILRAFEVSSPGRNIMFNLKFEF